MAVAGSFSFRIKSDPPKYMTLLVMFTGSAAILHNPRRGIQEAQKKKDGKFTA